MSVFIHKRVKKSILIKIGDICAKSCGHGIG